MSDPKKEVAYVYLVQTVNLPNRQATALNTYAKDKIEELPDGSVLYTDAATQEVFKFPASMIAFILYKKPVESISPAPVSDYEPTEPRKYRTSKATR